MRRAHAGRLNHEVISLSFYCLGMAFMERGQCSFILTRISELWTKHLEIIRPSPRSRNKIYFPHVQIQIVAIYTRFTASRWYRLDNLYKYTRTVRPPISKMCVRDTEPIINEIVSYKHHFLVRFPYFLPSEILRQNYMFFFISCNRTAQIATHTTSHICRHACLLIT